MREMPSPNLAIDFFNRNRSEMVAPVNRSLLTSRFKARHTLHPRALRLHHMVHSVQHDCPLTRGVSSVATVLRHHRVMMPARAAARGAKKHLVVFGRLAARIKPANFLQHRPPEHHGHRVRHVISLKQLFIVIGREQWPAWGVTVRAIACDVIKIPDDKPGVRVCRQTAQVRLDRYWCQAIIGIEKDDILPAAGAKASVSRFRATLIVLAKVTNGWVSRRDLPRVIGRSIIDDNRLDSRIGLREHALDRLRQKMRLLVTWYDD